MVSSVRRALVGTGSAALNIAGACLIGAGVPLFWVWLASTLYDESGAVTGSVVVFIFTGLLVSYWILLLIGSWAQSRLLSPGSEPGRPRRHSWNRSMRDSAYRPGEHRADPVERLFVTTAILSMIAFVIWFIFFAGSPAPGQ